VAEPHETTEKGGFFLFESANKGPESGKLLAASGKYRRQPPLYKGRRAIYFAESTTSFVCFIDQTRKRAKSLIFPG
jgi:hypothetical protein